MAPAFLQGQTRSSSRPNILFIMDDQHRGDCTGADGNRAIRTPNIDRIGAEGARFRCAYSTTPTCTPARSGLMTGLAPWNHGMLHMVAMAEHYPFTMPRALRDAGYYTMGIGKMHYHPQRNLNGFHHAVLDESGRVQSPDFRSDYRAWFWSQAPHLDPDATGIGFNDYPAKPYALPEKLHPTWWTGQTAVNFLEGYKRPEPFFLKVSFARPHSPYDPPERLMKHYADADIPKASVGKWAAKYRASQRTERRHLARRSGRRASTLLAPGLLRFSRVRGRADRQDTRSAIETRMAGANPDRLHFRSWRHDGRSQPVAQVVWL